MKGVPFVNRRYTKAVISAFLISCSPGVISPSCDALEGGGGVSIAGSLREFLEPISKTAEPYKMYKNIF